MFWKILIYVSIAAILAVFLIWIIDSKDYGEPLIFSKDKKPVVTVVKDELFGNNSQKIDWKDGYWMGLLPGEDRISIKALMSVAPLTGIFIVMMLISIFMNFKRKK